LSSTPNQVNPQPESLLEVNNLTKRFPLVVANDGINFDVRKGEIHCLLGENGAGKTTLAECLYGYYQPDAGEIRYKGELVSLSSPSDAIKLGIGMVHQHFMLVEPCSVLENIILGTDSGGIAVNYKHALVKIEQLCKQYSVDLNPYAKIWQLSVGEQQWVEIFKALYVGAELLIMDEPTAVLTPQESDHLFAVLQQMKTQGLSIIFITHKLREVMAVSDRVTILRKGKKVDTVNTRDSSRRTLAQMMVGRDVAFEVKKPEVTPGKPVLEISNLQAKNDLGQMALLGLDLKIHEGEIVGFAGVAGNGQKELMEVLIGVRHAENGSINIMGKDISNLSTRRIMNLGVGHIPSDRIKQGLILDFSVSENMILGNEWEKPYRKGMVLDEKTIQAITNDGIADYEIDTPSAKHKTQYLSGGNLQKVILARELGKSPKLLLADQPCRGLDIGVIEYVHQQLLKLRSEGVGILLISEDLDEILSLTDRLMVMFKGQILGEFMTREAKRDQLGLLMAGCVEDQS
jgi:general nucleoside transport system ATP-binding protein